MLEAPSRGFVEQRTDKVRQFFTEPPVTPFGNVRNCNCKARTIVKLTTI